MRVSSKNARSLIDEAVSGADFQGARNLIDISMTDWDEEAQSWQAVHEEVYGEGGKCGFMTMVEQSLVKLIWKKLPSSTKSKVDMKKLETFINGLDDGDSLSVAAKGAKIPTAVAVNLLDQIDKTGLL